MDPTRDLPLGFGMALMQNRDAFRAFRALPPGRQQELIARTRAVSSREEMRSLVGGPLS